MTAESDKELEQLKKLDKLRKLVQTILMNHLVMLIIVFVLILASVLTFAGMSVSRSPDRYLSRLSLSFYPKQKGKIGQYDDKYLLRLLNRQTTRMRFVNLGEKKNQDVRRQVAQKIQISLDRKQPHNFSIQLNAASEEAAVNMINEFAQVCIHEYIRERTLDLRKWKSVLDKERKEMNRKIQGCSDQITKLTLPMHIISPEKDYERIRTQMNEFQIARTRLNVMVENLKRRKNQLEKDLTKVNPAVVLHQQEIKTYQSELEKLDHEIEIAAEMYTEENPKMIAIVSRRNVIRKRLDTFLKSKGIESVDPQLIAAAEKQSAELKELNNELETKQAEMRVLQGEIEACRKRFQILTEYQPKLQQLTQQRQSLTDSLQRLDESISEINYMLLMVKEDLFITEKASAAVGNQPFAKKNLAICLFAAVALTCFLAAVTALLEFFFGRVANAQELMLYDEFHYLGVLPVSEEMFNSKDREKMAFNKLFHNFQAMNLHVIFTGALPGSRIINRMFDFFEWNFAMSGHRMLLVDMVLADEFEGIPDTDSETMIVTFSGGKCYLPLASKKYLAPSELELLKNDFQLLKKNYDYVFIRHTFTMRRCVLFLEQIAEFCDGMMIAVGAGKTPRKSLRMLISSQQKFKLPVMTILTDHFVKKLNKDLNQEAES